MRKLISLAMGLALATTVFTAVPASADPATVVRPGGLCGMPGAGPGGELIYGGEGALTHLVQNDNHIVMTCKGTGITNFSGRTQEFNDFPCGVVVQGADMLPADQSHATVTKKGRASVTCKVDFAD